MDSCVASVRGCTRKSFRDCSAWFSDASPRWGFGATFATETHGLRRGLACFAATRLPEASPSPGLRPPSPRSVHCAVVTFSRGEGLGLRLPLYTQTADGTPRWRSLRLH